MILVSPNIDVKLLQDVDLPAPDRAVVDLLLRELIHGILPEGGIQWLRNLQAEIEEEMRADAMAHMFQLDDYGS